MRQNVVVLPGWDMVIGDIEFATPSVGIEYGRQAIAGLGLDCIVVRTIRRAECPADRHTVGA